MTVSVTALRSLNYQGRSLVAGAIFDVTPVEAAVLARQGAVSLHRVAAVEAPPPRTKRRYRRRDLTAEV
mgnify:CR=1 FL=1